jgi:putative oxidoreductase
MDATVVNDPRHKATTRRAGTIVLWALQIALAVSFVGAGLAKVAGDPQMVDTFTKVGVGQWLRYLVGALELAGAVGLLIPRLAGLAAVGLAALMIGATITNLVVLDTSPALPLGFLLVAGLIAWIRRDQLKARLRSLRLHQT